MDHFAGLDVSVKETSICIVDDAGKIVREVKVASEPEALLAVLKNPAYHFKRIDSQKFTDITVEATTDPTTAAALGDAAGTAFVTGLNLEQRLAAILPDRLTVIAGPVADGIQHGITTRTTNLLTSEGFASTWRTAIQGLYERFLAVMRGTAPNATLNGSTLTIDVKGAVMSGSSDSSRAASSRPT